MEMTWEKGGADTTQLAQKKPVPVLTSKTLPNLWNTQKLQN